ncbi:MAG: alpha/beta hydrolase [Myxococcota bacterium]
MPLTDRGEGPAVVFLHGNPESRRGWDHIIDALEGVRCLAPDLPGFAGSSPPPQHYDFSLTAQLRFFEDLLDTLGLDSPVTVVAHDIGALMAIPFAAKHPGRVRRLVLMNTVFDPTFRWFPMARIWAHPIAGWLFMRIMNRFAFKKALASETTAEVVAGHGDRIYEALSPATKAGIRALYAKMTRPGFFEPHMDALATVRAQATTRVLWGATDGFIPVEDARRLSEAPIVVEDAGHWLPLERPDRVIEQIVE